MIEKVLSIVVPAYNMEQYIGKCLSSLVLSDERLMNQLEVIVVNDGSIDNTSAIAHEYETRYPGTFQVVDKENGNYGSCVNVGLDLATGKYFRILDADDWFDTGVLNLFIQQLLGCTANLVITPFRTYGTDGEYIESSSDTFEIGKVYNIEALSGRTNEMSIHMHTMTFASSVLKKCNLSLSVGVSYSDTEYCYFPLACVETVVFYDSCLYQYLLGRVGQTMSLESQIRSLHSMSVVAARLASDYALRSVHGGAASEIQYMLVTRILGMLYYIGIIESGKSSCVEDDLKRVDVFVRRSNQMNSFSKSLVYNHIHFVPFWRLWGEHKTGLVFSLYLRSLSGVRQIKRCLLANNR